MCCLPSSKCSQTALPLLLSLGARCWVGSNFEMSHGRDEWQFACRVICFGVKRGKCILMFFYSLHKSVQPARMRIKY